MTIGSASLARNIYDIYHNNHKVPSDWSYLASGSTRSVYLGPDGIVYKLCHDGDYDWNLVENELARKWRGSKKLEPLETEVPRVRLHYGGHVKGESQYVLAMEYVPRAMELDCHFYTGPDEPEDNSPCDCRYWGQARICFAVLCDRLEALGIHDMFSGNVHYGHDKLFHIIDLGCD